ncbi:FluC/FEX family fluoride channel [Rhabdothermincola salaria]|uniref:FluC/FEX family fluoride channel n=1 Tax=Rhabdothermincola salaria TaxID=2903142 RepID=UPI001E57252E|nr:CrcB family protein [Rhabdothermincola salaria]
MRTTPARVLAVAVGGALGTWLRWAVVSTWPIRPDRFPTTTLVVNLVGAFVLALVIVALLERRRRALAHALLGTGLLGALTTFSTMSVEVVTLVRLQHFWVGAAYLVVSLVLGVLAMIGGLALGRSWWRAEA